MCSIIELGGGFTLHTLHPTFFADFYQPGSHRPAAPAPFREGARRKRRNPTTRYYYGSPYRARR